MTPLIGHSFTTVHAGPTNSACWDPITVSSSPWMWNPEKTCLLLCTSNIPSMQMKTHHCRQDKVFYCQQHSLCHLSYDNTHRIATVRRYCPTFIPGHLCRSLSVALRLAKCVSGCSPLSKERRSLSPSPIPSHWTADCEQHVELYP